MRFLNVLFFLFVAGIGGSCGLFSDESTGNNEDEATLKFAGDVSSKCSDNQRCRNYCGALFSHDVSLRDKCADQALGDVSKINSAISAMDSGHWSSIKREHLHILIEFDKSIWLEYASINNKVSAQSMLLWIAQEEEIANLLGEGEGQEVLKNAFAVLGAPAYDDAVLKGMKMFVDLDKDQGFFEVSVLKGNDNAFQEAHELLKKECGSRVCVKNIYCEIDQDVVFGKLNQLELAQDAEADGALYREDCT